MIEQAVSVAGETLLIVGSAVSPVYCALDAQALHSVFLVGDDLSGKRQTRVEAEVCDGGEHRLSRFGCVPRAGRRCRLRHPHS